MAPYGFSAARPINASRSDALVRFTRRSAVSGPFGEEVRFRTWWDERFFTAERPTSTLTPRIPAMHAAPNTTGLVIHWAARYDLLAWLLTHGRERAFREKLIALARIAPGESVLDVGCGTGTLAIAAKRQAGPAGQVCGIDASPSMNARARSKA